MARRRRNLISVFFLALLCACNGEMEFQITPSSDGDGNSSTSTITDTTPPPQQGNVTLSSPATNPYLSNTGTVTLSGTCVAGLQVSVSGDIAPSDVITPAGTTTHGCAAGTFSFVVSKTVDGSFNFTLTQGSSSATATWVRNTSVPATPVISAPAASPYYSNGSGFVISGSCTDGHLVRLTGAASQQAPCGGGTFSFTISSVFTDGAYNYFVDQVNACATTSPQATVSWIRDIIAPAAPGRTAPSSNPFYSGDTTLLVSGSCENGATVNLSGDASGAGTCAASAFTFNVTKSVDGTYNFSLSQTDQAGNSSGLGSFQWIRDTTIPATPTIISPASNPYYSNGGSVTISGGCTTGYTVSLSGSDVQSATCSGGSYSFVVNKSVDGSYPFSVKQTRAQPPADSASASLTWVRDTVVPATPSIADPASSPFYSPGSAITISGSCEAGATVQLSGASSATATCSGSADYLFIVNKSVDGSYAFSVSQSDQAGNVSGAAALTWERDTGVPIMPTVIGPGPSPYYTSGSSITLSGACEAGATVQLSDAATASVVCSATPDYSFVVNKTLDGTYNFSIAETDPAGNVSDSAAFTWVRDTVAPPTPSKSAPASNPFTSGDTNLSVTGSCENGATVNLTGDASGSVVCASSAFSFTITKSVDGTYNFSLAQTDLAGNSSAAGPFQWIRDTTIPSTPTVLAPAANPYSSNGGSIVISGACTATYTVTLSVADSQSATCAGDGTYSFMVNKTLDGNYVFNVKQTRPTPPADSGSATITWVRDTSVPSSPSISGPGASPYYSSGSSITISGACEAGATVQVSGDATASVTCSATPDYFFIVSKSVDATYNFTVSQTDQAGNASSPAAFTWVRDTAAPGNPSITGPGSSPYYTSGNSITISGACEAGATVQVSGDATGTVVCSATPDYSLVVNKIADGTYNFSISQTDLAGNASGASSFTWVRDTVAPSAPARSAPALSPFYSGDTNLSVSGSCENGATVNLSGDASGSVACASSAFSFTITKSVDSTYNFNLSQTDVAGNVSASDPFQWVRDTSVPSTPTITGPAANPYYSNGNSVVISGACAANYTVSLSGADTQSVTCTAGGTYSFTTANQTVDGSYLFNVKQTRPLPPADSGTATLTWVRDTAAPAAPGITGPGASPYNSNGSAITISGSCEAGATVQLSGAASATTTCSGISDYSFVVNKNTDATYNFTVSQADQASNASSGTAFTWMRDTSAPAIPTITSPTYDPHVTLTTASITLSGGCEANATVTLSGAGSGTTTCSGVSTYSFPSLSQGAEGRYDYNVTQTDLAGNVSGIKTFKWVINSQATYTWLKTNIFDNVSYTGHCTGCHDGSTVYDIRIYNQVVNAAATQSAGTRVIPYDLVNSVFYKRINGLEGLNQMPKSGALLNNAQKQVIYDWIQGGAQE